MRARAKTPLQKAPFWRARARGTLKRDSNKKSKPKPWYLHYFFNMLKTKFITKGMNMRNFMVFRDFSTSGAKTKV